MVLPPRHVYSAIVKNTTSNVMKVKATYGMPNNAADEEVELSIQPAATVNLEQKVVQVEQMTLTGYIRRIAVEGAALEAPFSGVTSPVKDYRVEIYAEDGVPQLRGQP
ncbi:hypothetical protein DQ04_00271050 [Trypanosoma grayi]|uniref:hypothetical protein n=1 Tax=Trypanosoma grayi TaxID=71804 RepID=UPI0004F4A0C4|nr:hypothetical protein DQ04_00271050 [Trypanosoma grayi]KEG14871.1 hypothetical protein DQ04_00271050 [Trypanosoma grayi]